MGFLGGFFNAKPAFCTWYTCSVYLGDIFTGDGADIVFSYRLTPVIKTQLVHRYTVGWIRTVTPDPFKREMF